MEDRVVTGLPIKRLGSDDPDDYGRDIAPEMLSDGPYDPFKTDIFQIGKMFYDYFCVSEHWFLVIGIRDADLVWSRSLQLVKGDAPGLVGIFEAMMANDANSRPNASKALDMVRAYEKAFPRAQLALPVREAVFPDANYMEKMQRKAAKAKAKAEAEALAASNAA